MRAAELARKVSREWRDRLLGDYDFGVLQLGAQASQRLAQQRQPMGNSDGDGGSGR